MKITVLGGAGAMAKSAVLDLVESPEVNSLTLADINFKTLEELKNSLKSKKVSIARVDITDHGNLVQVIHGSDAVINGTDRVYLIYEADLSWYQQALEIVLETIEYVLSQPDKEKYVLHWSS